jgi:HEAT repeat protein
MQEAVEVATALQLSAKALQFYTADHPRVTAAIAQLEQACATLLNLRSRVALTAAKGSLLVDGEPVAMTSVHCRTLAAELERRQLGGVIFFAGVRRRDLLELARLLTLRPEQIKSVGGRDAILEAAAVEYLRISHVRYEAVTEGEEVVWSNSMRRADADGTPLVSSLQALVQQLLQKKTGGIATDAGAGTGSDTGTGDPEAVSSADAVTQPEEAAEVIRAAMAEMDPTTRLAMLLSIDQLPEGSTRDLLRRAAGDPARALVQTLAKTDDQLSLLSERLREMGVTREQLDEMLDVVSWEKLPVEERIAKLSEGTRIFDFPADKLLRFLKLLLDEGRAADVQQVLVRYVTGLAQQSLYVRRTVCDTLGQVALFIKKPGLPREVEQLVGTAILNQFVLETDPAMRTALTGAAANFIAMLVATGRSEPALRVVARLDAAVPSASSSLSESFGEAHRATELVAQSISADPESLAHFVLPLIARLGGAATPAFIETLSTSEDRNHRGRLVKALKTIGDPAFPHLLNALRSTTWFVVRNTLNVFGDIGRAEHVEAIGKRLSHGDPRVRRAAVRALSKIGGPEAEALLVGAAHDKDEETQAEVLLCLGSIKAQSAVPTLAELARVRLLSTDDKVRELAIATLGHIGNDAAVSVLGEIVRAKSFFGGTPAIRAAATRALGSINSPAARELLKQT